MYFIYIYTLYTYLHLSAVIWQCVNISITEYIVAFSPRFFSQLSRHFCVDQKPFQIDPHTKVAHTHTHTHTMHTWPCVSVCVWELAFKAAINSKNQTIRCSEISSQSSKLAAFGFGFRFSVVFFCIFESRLDFWYLRFFWAHLRFQFLADTQWAYLCVCAFPSA